MKTPIPRIRRSDAPLIEWGLSQSINLLNCSHYAHLILLLMMEHNICIMSANKANLCAMMYRKPFDSV